jgi:hypothetical protein
MHARVSTFTGTPDQLDAGVATFRSQVVPFISEAGGLGSLLLVDRQSGKAVGITLWPDEATMAASDERANQLRSEATSQAGATAPPTVERFEVAVYDT